ncbi:glycine-rich domain-containing protein 1-like [Tasmannia lanceolata]|uniref:glycine-rich domain-containing protein 1-like n=1 Tax=Tasmannia lanceolata TaxID=3420 RepID=UPI004063CE12
MDKAQELEWLEAQKIVISADLVAVAKRQLHFLAAVDRNRCLYDGPILERAIYRYKACWLPLLAKHAESLVVEGPLVVPLDCEWIWHCHRLNPVQYKRDCEQFYGQILDNQNVISILEGTSKQKTSEIWGKLFPEEPYELDFSIPNSENTAENLPEAIENIRYDLVSAVKRQSSFFFQVSSPSMRDDCFLKGAVARYKGFLYLIKRNMERSIRRFCVPTYDIDLIWHTHQLQPISYCKDLVEVLGKVLEHDDMDSDRSKGQKLDVGFSETTKQWEETFGWRYWRAGAMYRGNAPSPVTVIPWPSSYVNKNVIPCSEYQKDLHLSPKKLVEVNLEIVGIRNLPDGHKGNLFVSFSKSQPDIFFNTSRTLCISSECGEKHVSFFQCEPNGELMFALISYSPSYLPISRRSKTMGMVSISLQDLLEPDSKLSVEKWFELTPNSGISLHIAVSFSVPALTPHVLHVIRSRPFSADICYFPLAGRGQQLRRWTCVVDCTASEIMSLQMRNTIKAEGRKREVVGVLGWSGETRVLAEFVGEGWTVTNSSWFLHLEKKSSHDGHIVELRGDRPVKLFPGRKLEYELKCRHGHKNEKDFMTLVGFSMEDPYGKAVALFNLKSGLLKVNEDWFVLPGIVLAFLLSDMLRKKDIIVPSPSEEVSR